jgi:two-component system LytT family sensor kinase
MFKSINYNMKKSTFTFLVHFLYWAPHFIWLFYMYSANYRASYLNSANMIYAILSNGVALVTFYVFYLLLIPTFFTKRKFIAFTILGIITVFVIGFLAYNSFNAIWGSVYFGKNDTLPMSKFGDLLTSAAFSVLPAAGVRVIVNWYTVLQYKRQLEKRNLETELALLKAQINPHFLFNTLNNIDILIEQDAKTASVYLKKLSDILRFMLYESPTEKIKLTQEIAYINEYIELQKIRTTNANFVKFTVDGNTDNLQIAPMLFIPFIENAFKHSTDKRVSNAIEIDIAVKDKEIYFTCSNAMDTSAQLTQPKSGLGLDLIKNRLKLLYKEHHQLKIDKTNERFIVTLTVKLHDH